MSPPPPRPRLSAVCGPLAQSADADVRVVHGPPAVARPQPAAEGAHLRRHRAAHPAALGALPALPALPRRPRHPQPVHEVHLPQVSGQVIQQGRTAVFSSSIKGCSSQLTWTVRECPVYLQQIVGFVFISSVRVDL